MAAFMVTYQHASAKDRFYADEVALTSDGSWFHFIRDGLVVVRVSAGDVRVIENVTFDETVKAND